MAGKQNHGERWDADAMIRNAKALQRVVKELEKNKPKPLWRKKPQCHSFKPLVDGRIRACRPGTPRKRNSLKGLSQPSWANRTPQYQ